MIWIIPFLYLLFHKKSLFFNISSIIPRVTISCLFKICAICAYFQGQCLRKRKCAYF